MKQGMQNNLTRQGILRALRRNDELLQKHSVRTIALFGSYATGRQNRKSDLDFLVDFERPSYDNFLGLLKDLERLFGRKVDILTPQGLESIRVKNRGEYPQEPGLCLSAEMQTLWRTSARRSYA